MKTKVLLTTLLLSLSLTALYAQVAINNDGTSPDTSAMLDVKSSTKGMLIPRMSTAQRLAIPAPAVSLLVFDTDSTKFYYYTSTGWKMIRTGTTGAPSELMDADGDTKIEVEKNPDEDKIRFSMAGTEYFRMEGPRLYVLNSGSSVFFGNEAGQNEDLAGRENTFLGHQAAKFTTTGGANTSVGAFSLYSNVSGYHNTAVGYRAMYGNTSGTYNVGIGTSALGAANANASVGIGDSVLYQSTGSGNLAAGHLSMRSSTTGSNNTALGSGSLYSNTSGSNNVALGSDAMYSNATGSENVAVGRDVLRNNTTYGKNTALGFQALYTGLSENNTAVGYRAMYSISPTPTGSGILPGSENVAFGSEALFYDSTGGGNVAIGYRSLYSNKSGGHNIAIGHKSMYNNISGTDNIAIGPEALFNNTSSFENVAIGLRSLRSNTTGYRNVAIGSEAGFSCDSGDYNVFIGYRAGYHETGSNKLYIANDSVGPNQALIYGDFKLKQLRVNASLTIGTGITNKYTFPLADGPSGYVMATGTSDTLVWRSPASLGAQKIDELWDGKSSASDSYSSVFLGADAGAADNSTFNKNVGVGLQALRNDSTGEKNVAIGYQSLFSSTTGSNNVAVGHAALDSNATGSMNTAVGSDAFVGSGNYDNSTAIGFNTVITASNQVRIGNASVTSIGGFAAWTNLSDGRFKTNVQTNVPGLNLIMKLRPVTYTIDMNKIARHLQTSSSLRNTEYEANKAKEVQIGFIAQEVEQAAEEVGFDFHAVDKPDNEKDYYGLRYSEFVPVLVKAVQEQQTEIMEILKRIEELEKQKINK